MFVHHFYGEPLPRVITFSSGDTITAGTVQSTFRRIVLGLKCDESVPRPERDCVSPPQLRNYCYFDVRISRRPRTTNSHLPPTTLTNEHCEET